MSAGVRKLDRAYRAGDLIEVVKADTSMFIQCPVGQAVVLKASDWHCINLKSYGGACPPDFTPYYQILKVMSGGQSFYNIHSHNVRLLSPNETS